MYLEKLKELLRPDGKLDGVFLVDKPAGITSYDVIRGIKHELADRDMLKGQKIGHAGTLDPFATGLLIILFGSATKKFDDFQKMKKTYIVEAEFGYETDSYDVTGEIVKDETADVKNNVVSRDKLEKAIASKFIGKIMQTPPKFSAKKVNGARAYDLARKNVDFELKPVEVEVFRYEITDYKWPRVKFIIECSSGTYIRSLVVDLAREVGSSATCVSLRRISVGEFVVEV